MKASASITLTPETPTAAEAVQSAHAAFSAACTRWSILFSDKSTTYEQIMVAKDAALDAKALITGYREPNVYTRQMFSKRFTQSLNQGDTLVARMGRNAQRTVYAPHPHAGKPKLTTIPPCAFCGDERYRQKSGKILCRRCETRRARERKLAHREKQGTVEPGTAEQGMVVP